MAYESVHTDEQEEGLLVKGAKPGQDRNFRAEKVLAPRTAECCAWQLKSRSLATPKTVYLVEKVAQELPK